MRTVHEAAAMTFRGSAAVDAAAAAAAAAVLYPTCLVRRV